MKKYLKKTKQTKQKQHNTKQKGKKANKRNNIMIKWNKKSFACHLTGSIYRKQLN